MFNSHTQVAVYYNNAGNPFYHDKDGQWKPYNYAAPPVVPPVHNNSNDGPNPPVSDAFSHCVSDANPTAPIDPNLLSMHDRDHEGSEGGEGGDLSDPPPINQFVRHNPVKKVAGARRKGKQNADVEHNVLRKRKPEPINVDDASKLARRGRPNGAGNYSPEDITTLLDLTREELPLGQRGWDSIHGKYNKWACAHNRPERTVKSVETKFKQLVKTTKPTGDGVCPPYIKRAHEIDGLINERAGLRDLNDSDFDDTASVGHVSISSSNEAECDPVKVAVAHRHTQPIRRNARGGNGLELLDKMTQIFDPAVQKARDQQRAQRSLENTQFITLAQQLRDSQSMIEGLRTQVTQLQARIHDTERARDRAEIRLEMMELSQHRKRRSRSRSSDRERSSRRHTHKRRKSRCETVYPEGGRYTYWVTDEEKGESLGDEDDKEKENIPPQHRPRYARHAQSQSHSSAASAASSGPSNLPFLTGPVQPDAQQEEGAQIAVDWSLTSRTVV